MPDNGMDIPAPPTPMIDAETLKAMEERRPWRWRNCRGLRLRLDIEIMPWDWRIAARVMRNEHYEFAAAVCFGPIGVAITADIGNCGSDNPLAAYMGLSEDEAWERSAP